HDFVAVGLDHLTAGRFRSVAHPLDAARDHLERSGVTSRLVQLAAAAHVGDQDRRLPARIHRSDVSGEISRAACNSSHSVESGVAETPPVSLNSDPCRRAATIGIYPRRIYTLLTSIGNTTRVICACS